MQYETFCSFAVTTSHLQEKLQDILITAKEQDY